MPTELRTRDLGQLIHLMPQLANSDVISTEPETLYKNAAALERAWRFLVQNTTKLHVDRFQLVHGAVIGDKQFQHGAVINTERLRMIIPNVCYVLSARETYFQKIPSDPQASLNSVLAERKKLSQTITEFRDFFTSENTQATRLGASEIRYVNQGEASLVNYPKAVLLDGKIENVPTTIFAYLSGFSPLAILESISAMSGVSWPTSW